ncbi:MAG TPA: competence/damage-inducible protein A [Symbiobacteriaceae bacterium]|nr:competence/damage-inducible protein A [Symbiobacteriaceae bacterium]
MKAELVFVGTELLLGEILNTNAQYLSQQLALLGIDVYYQQVVGDNYDRARAIFAQALERSDVVIASGGLGPTMDDITRDVAAEAAGRPLELNEQIHAELKAWFERRGRTMTENNARQALVPEGAAVLHNDRGTAPGLAIPCGGGKVIILLPGPPNELRPMFERHVVPYLTKLTGGAPLALVTRTLRFIDIGESALEEALRDIITQQSDPSIAPYAKTGEVHLRLATKASTPEAGLARILPVEQAIRGRVGHHIYGIDSTSLEAAVGHLLKERGLHVTVAESCSGGLIAKRITDIPGSSAYFDFGFVTYSNTAKMRMLGVPAELLEAHGAVCEQVVAAMAQGALAAAGADIAVAVSGIAGPDGGTPEKPVGTVCLGLAARGSGVWTRTLHLWGSRADIRDRTATQALAMIRRHLLGQRV